MSIILDGVSRKSSREHNQRAWIAWHIAALSRVRKFPKLETLLVKDRAAARRRRQTPDQMLAIAKMMAGMSFPSIRSSKA